MTSQTLREARKYEEASEKMIQKEERPDFHLSVRTGWMNDPNGFSYYKGRYHMFYQYYPYDTKWGPMHWGHAVSTDLLHWDYLPAALAPDEAYDRDGCFSSSAIELPDGRQLLMYTGVVRTPQWNGGHCDIQTQCIAVGDGVDYEKCDCNPVLDSRDLPNRAICSIIRRCGRTRTEGTGVWSETARRTEAGRSCFSPARMRSGGSMKRYLRKTGTGSEKCGSVRISLNWTANGCC